MTFASSAFDTQTGIVMSPGFASGGFVESIADFAQVISPVDIRPTRINVPRLKQLPDHHHYFMLRFDGSTT